MTRKQWRQRLIDAELPEEVVSALMDSVSDKDLVRMKDLSDEELAEAVTTALKAGGDATPAPRTTPITCSKCGTENPADAAKCTKCDAGLEEEEEEEEEAKPVPPATKDLTTFADYLVGCIDVNIKKALADQTIEVEVPELTMLKDAVDALRSDLEEVQTVLKDMAQADTERLAALAKDLSPAQRIRLRQSVPDGDVAVRILNRLKEAGKVRSVPDGTVFDIEDFTPVIKDAAGNVYESLQDMATGVPVS